MSSAAGVYRNQAPWFRYAAPRLLNHRYCEPMRLWLKDSERRPDPQPLQTDDRKAILVGLVLWLVALGGLLLFLAAVLDGGHAWWLWTVLIGLGLGLVLLVFAHRKQV